ncbi:MAG TPA: hypothetical protein VHK02_11725 [Actinomycetota bacterium]|nr:hypothetical protein [Actinomycetota bacterium]
MTDRRLEGVIRDVAMLDLTPLTSAEDLAGITRLEDVAIVLAPQSLMSAVVAIPMDDVAMVVPVPDGVGVHNHTGALVMGGEALASPEAENAVLVVTGTLVLTSPVPKVAYRQVIVIGLVLAPHGSESALGAGLTRVTGSVDYYPSAEPQEVKVSTGQLRADGEFLANPTGGPDDILVVAGQLIVTGPVAKVGYRRVIVAGQMLAPRDAQAVLGPALVVKGQLAWYTGQPRIFVGKETLGRSFFELLDRPARLALVGRFDIDPDVPPELLREKIQDITLVGKLVATSQLVGALQLLTTEKVGTITVAQNDHEPR